MRACSSEGGQALPLPKVALYFQELLVILLEDEHIHSQVLEVSCQRSCMPFHSELVSSEMVLTRNSQSKK